MARRTNEKATAGNGSTRETLLAQKEIVYGANGYTNMLALTKAYAQGHFSRSWWQGANLISGQLDASLGGGLWKCDNRFRPALTYPLLDSLQQLGIKQPASYSSCYHAIATQPPRVTYTLNQIFSWWPGGPWQEAKTTGKFFGAHYRYDLCSAYRWASTLGLPDVTTFRVWRRHPNPREVDGLWVVSLPENKRHGLPPLLRDNPVVVSSEDLRIYDLTPTEVHRGVTWTKFLAADYVEQTLSQLPCAKEAGRAYWGRWIARDRLTCRTKNNQWALPNLTTNFVWGFLIIARVRSKVWQSASNALHVYVDEILIPHEIETGDKLGDWRLKEAYPKGVNVMATGWLSTPNGNTIMRTGMPLNLRPNYNYDAAN